MHADVDGQLDASVLRIPFPGRVDDVRLADWIMETAERRDVGVIAIDGPLAWRDPDTDSVHSRLAERAVRAPGKTGLPPDGVKPHTYLGFTSHSIALAEHLTTAGWEPVSDPHSAGGTRMITETFPTAAWRQLGLPPLPGKSRATLEDVTVGLTRLQQACTIRLSGVETHDDLQAVTGGIAPAWWRAGCMDRVTFAGAPPFRRANSWREGYIIIPARRGETRVSD